MGIASDLRESVLQAAMQGKLTTQKAEDGDARNLLREIREEKEKLVKDKKIKKEKPLAPITDDETPYDIPDNWVWVRHNDIFSIVGGSQPPKAQFSDTMKDGYVRLYQTRDYGNKPVPVYVSKKSVSKFTKEGDILLARYGGSLGKVFIAHDGAYNVALAKSQNLFKSNLCLTEYKLLFYKSSLYQSFISLMKNGRSAQSGFNKDDLNILLFPLPPLAEQHRIVERVDELMKEIDKLEKTEKELEAIKTAFPADMKSSLLQAAMEGKLTTQKAEDGDARDLLREIRAEKEKLVKEKKIKREKPLAPIMDDEIPFDIPDNWVWCRLGNLVFNHGQKKPDKTFSYIDVGTLDNVNHKLNNKENILEAENAPSRARKIVKKGDVLYSTVRPYLHNICIIDRALSHEPIASTAFAVMSCLEGLYNKYLYWCLLSPCFDAYANDPNNSKGVAYPAINDKTFYNAIIPLPPLAEQHRIVEKLDQLIPLCDSLSKN